MLAIVASAACGLAPAGRAQVTFYPVVSCAPEGTCTVGGACSDAASKAQGYVTGAR